MQLIFFKAAPPYNKTTGFWERRYWSDGVTGPLTHGEAQRLSAMLGGRWFEVTAPVRDLEEFFEKLGIEMPEELQGEQKPGQLTSEQQFGKSDLKPVDTLELVKQIVMNSTPAENKKRIENVLGEDVPAYAEQVKALADSKDEFDYISVIGRKRDVASILRAYTILKFKDIDISKI